MKSKVYSGINIQFPMSELILLERKTIETRTYRLPDKYIGTDLLLIETPGKAGDFKARVTGIIRFTDSFKYPSKTAFYSDEKNHLVTPGSTWKWTNLKPKWGWRVQVIKRFKHPITLNMQKGIVFTKDIDLNVIKQP